LACVDRLACLAGVTSGHTVLVRGSGTHLCCLGLGAGSRTAGVSGDASDMIRSFLPPLWGSKSANLCLIRAAQPPYAPKMGVSAASMRGLPVFAGL
jgi:hypothetical protein